MAKILYIVTQGEMGGAQKYVYDLATHLPQNHTPLVAIGPENPHLAKKLADKNIQAFTLNHLIRNIHPIKDLLAVFEIYKLIQNEKPDIIHLNSSKTGVLGSAAGWLSGTPVIFTAHGLAFLEPKSWSVKQIYYWAERLSMPFRDIVITVSDFDRKKALENKLGSAKKFVTIHNGIDFEQLNFLPKEQARDKLNSKFGFRNSKFIIGTIANLYKTKGLDHLIEAAKKVVNHNGEIIFTVIGEGSQRKSLETKIKNYNLEKNFLLLGEIPNASKYLKAFDIFVLPSVKEGFPYTVLEAAAAGLPIIASRIGGIPEILSAGAGVLLEPSDEAALAHEIITLSSDIKKQQRLAGRAESEIKKFTISNMVNKTIDIYNKFL